MTVTTQSNLRQFPSRVGARTGFVLSLSEYEKMALEYIEESYLKRDNEGRLAAALLLSNFILWLRQRMETTDEKSAN